MLNSYKSAIKKIGSQQHFLNHKSLIFFIQLGTGSGMIQLGTDSGMIQLGKGSGMIQPELGSGMTQLGKAAN